jgi:hypothetical protein
MSSTPANLNTPTTTLHEEPVDIPLQDKSVAHPNPEAEPDNNEVDREIQLNKKRELETTTTAEEEDPEVLIVDWEGPDDPENPKK